LPALPKAWPAGAVKGLKARGNYEIEMSWNAGLVTNVKIKSTTQTNAKVLMNGKMQLIKTTKL
jgi:alpha-L-fucosidase 2